MAAKNPREIVEYQSDHDLLIELRTEMRGVRGDIGELKTNMASRVHLLENDHVTRREVTALSDEISSLKLWRSFLAGAWTICTLILIPIAFAYFA